MSQFYEQDDQKNNKIYLAAFIMQHTCEKFYQRKILTAKKYNIDLTTLSRCMVKYKCNPINIKLVPNLRKRLIFPDEKESMLKGRL